MSKQTTQTPLARSLFVILTMAIAATAIGQDRRFAIPVANALPPLGGTWVAQGPGPANNGQLEGIPNLPVVGAVNTVIAHPTNANTVWIGAANGGIWKTTNATSGSPTWTPQTDAFGSLSISAFDLDPSSSSILVAGTGNSSSWGLSGPQGRLLRTTDGGSSWTELTPGALLGRNISGVASRGATIVVSVKFACESIYRSTNTGASFTLVSGLPQGDAWDLTGDPTNSAILYTAIRDCFGSSQGVYRSTDTGATWTRVSNATMNSQLGTGNNAEIAVGASGQVYVAIVGSNGRLSGLFRSPDGLNWTQLDTPVTVENGITVGIHPGGQGGLHLSVVADPSNASVVYIGGDRQPLEFSFPTASGAFDYSGRLFRVNAGAAPGAQATPLTHCQSANSGCNGSISTFSNSAPHADSRAMAFLADGTLVEVDDGGIYRRTSPGSTGDWFSLIGNLQVAEMHDVAYDHLSNMIMSGNQDTGTPEQTSVGGTTWNSVSTADGGDASIDDTTSSTQSTRYSSWQNLGGFRRRTVNLSGTTTSTVFPAKTVVGGGPPLQPQFATPVELNRIDQRRILFVGSNDLYESLDSGDTISALGLNNFVQAAVFGGRSGGIDNLDLIYAISNFGVGPRVYLRTSGGGAPVATSGQPTTTENLRDIAVDVNDWQKAYVVTDAGNVYATSNAGATWSNVTGNLASGSTDFRTITHIPGSPSLIAVGGVNGVFRMAVNAAGTWNQLGTGLSNAIVHDLEYDIVDDVLVAGTLGRGAWKLTGVNGTPPNPPTNLVATATTSTNVFVSWTAVPGAAGYNVYRSNSGTNFTLLGSSGTAFLNDPTVSANTSYLYLVRAVSVGGFESTNSNIDLATTVLFTDATLNVASTVVKTVHFTELLTAVNAVRALAGQPAIGFTSPVPAFGAVALAAHMTDLRNGLTPARSALGLPAQGFTDVPVVGTSTVIKAVHINELRNGVR